MSRKKNIVILFSILLLALVLLTTVMDGTHVQSPPSPLITDEEGIDPTKSNEDPDEEFKVLKVTLSMEPQEFSLLQGFTKEFESAHPGATVELENILPEELYRTYKKRAQLGNASDVMLLNNIWINEFAALGYLSHRTDEFFSSELQSQQIEAVISQVKWNGYIWGVPKDIDPYVMVWNKTKLAEKNIEKPPASAEELIAVNNLLRDKETGSFGIYLDPEDPYAFLSLVWSAGGGAQATPGDNAALNHNSTLQLLQSLFSDQVELIEEEEALPFIKAYPDYKQNAREMLLEGKIAVLVTRASLYQNDSQENIEMMPLPVHKESEKAAWLQGRSYGVSSHSANAKEAYEWIQAMTDENKQIKMMNAGGGFPTIASLYKSTRLQSVKQIRTISTSIEQGKAISLEPLYPKKMMILQLEMEKLFKGKMNIKDFLDSVNEQWQSMDR